MSEKKPTNSLYLLKLQHLHGRPVPAGPLYGGYRQCPALRQPPVLLNPVQSKLPSFITVNVAIETDRSIIHDAFYVHYAAQKVMVYILQFNENTKHKFRRLCIYTALFYFPSAYDAQSDRL